MTDQLERDLVQLFAERAGAVDVPPVPHDLLVAEPTGPDRRLRGALVLAAIVAAAVAAVAIPIGLGSSDDPAPEPAPAPSVERKDSAPAIDLPYLLDGKLHVGGRSIATTGELVQVAGESVLVATYAASGAASWDRLVGDALVPVPHLDGVEVPSSSYDGKLVAAPVEDAAMPAIRIWSLETGAVVDTIAVDDPGAGEDQMLWGFDDQGRLYWQDGAVQWMRTAAGKVVALDTGTRQRVGRWPGGVLVRDGEAADAIMTTPRDDGTLVDVDKVPVSANAAWQGRDLVAYEDLGDGRTYVYDLRTHQRTEVRIDGEPPVSMVGWSGDDLVVVAARRDSGEVVVVDRPSGAVRSLPGVTVQAEFAITTGTGAM